MTRKQSELAGQLLREQPLPPEPSAHYAARRARLVGRAVERRAPRRLGAMLALAGASLSMLVLFGWWFAADPSETARLSFTVGETDRQGEFQAFYTSSGASLPLEFSDGTRIELESRAGVRVSQENDQETLVWLEDGRARFDVVHRADAVWRIAAGPYSVHVTGTSFDLGWSNLKGTLVVEMRSGSVLVTGPGIDSGITVRGTERFVGRVEATVGSNSDKPEESANGTAEPRVAAVPADPAAPVQDSNLGAVETSAAATPAAVGSLPARAERVPAMPPGGAPEPTSQATSWGTLAARGDYRRVVSEAEARGLASVLGSATSPELIALADAARFTGRADLAEQVLLVVRKRFSGSPRATGAAFVIGRMHDDSGRLKSALVWYDRYLSEGGPLSAEVAGRRMLTLHRLGETNGARQAGAAYLQRFPSGAYAEQARKLASE